MAGYTSLWTSSKDPEFQQIKKIKQLAERRLAMHVTSLEKDYNRHVKKSNDKIRENITVLEHLERDKEKRARHILATYLKVQKKKAAANAWTQKYFKSLALKRSNVKSPTEEKDEGPFVDIVTTRGTVSLKDFSLGKDKKKLSLPKIHLEANSEDTENALVRVEQANKSDQSGFSSPRNSTGGRGSEKMSGSGSNQTAVSARLLTKTLVDTISNKRDSLAESVESLKVPSLIDSMNHLKLQRKSQGGKLGNSGHAPAHRKLYLLRGSVYVTFPYVYHSLGEQTCPRYSLFRECTDYDPYANQVDGRKSKMSMASSHRYSNASLKSILSNATSRRNSHVSEGGDSTYPSGSRRGSKRVSFSNIAHVVRAVQDSHP